VPRVDNPLAPPSDWAGVASDTWTGRAAVLALVLFGAGLTVLAYLGAPRARLRPQAPPRRAVLAVLPFENSSGEPALELLANEITATVTAVLSERDEVAVVPRETSLEFEGVPGGVAAATEGLGADYAIAGSVGVEGGRLQVDAYLYRAGPDPAIWADRIEWSVEDTEGLPAEIARRVNEAIVERD
jgi:TolB-like protein